MQFSMFNNEQSPCCCTEDEKQTPESGTRRPTCCLSSSWVSCSKQRCHIACLCEQLQVTRVTCVDILHMSRFIPAVLVEDLCTTAQNTKGIALLLFLLGHACASSLWDFLVYECITEGSRAPRRGMKVWQVKITPQSLTNLLRRRRSSFARLMDGWDRWHEQDDKENICLQGQKGLQWGLAESKKKKLCEASIRWRQPADERQVHVGNMGVRQIVRQNGNGGQKKQFQARVPFQASQKHEI